MTVIDLGSETHGYEESLFTLIERLKPERVYAFDPLGPDEDISSRGVEIHRSSKAAWTFDGEISFGVGSQDAMNATAVRGKIRAGEWKEIIRVPCFDFAAFLLRFDEPVYVKMDVEGAEYDILEKVIASGADKHISFLTVEWHDHQFSQMEKYSRRRVEIIRNLSCPNDTWW